MQTQNRKVVTKIEANPLLAKQDRKTDILRVAAYCRVSTDTNDQIESYKAQKAYYSDVIARNPNWRFADIYADEGITGTLVKKRDNFKRMIRDCKKGKIDLILTKSVARFARNTVDSLRYVRQLKAQGIGVYFEEQSLDTLKEESEMALGIYSVLAQAESENISANVRWGIQQRMRSGTFKFRYNLLGYRKGEDGEPEIVPEEAETIRWIFQAYLDGKSLDQIRKMLEERGIRTAQGKTKWGFQIIQNILTNERYCGDLLLQKTFVENCITKKVKKNRGEMPKYLITDNHPAIIERSMFKAVQMEMARRGSKRKTADGAITEQGKHSGKYALTDILVCGECGSPYRRVTWKKRNGEKHKVWRCLSRIEHGTEHCKHSVSIEEEVLQDTICRALNKAVAEREDIMELLTANLSYAVTHDDETLNMYAIEKQIQELDREMDNAVRQSRTSGTDPKHFQGMIRQLCEQMAALRNQLEITKAKIASNATVSYEVERIKKILSDKQTALSEYNDAVVRYLVQYIRVMEDSRLIIVLKGEIRIEEKAKKQYQSNNT